MQVTQEMFIRVEEQENYNEQTGAWDKILRYSLLDSDMSKYAGYIMVDDHRHLVTFEIPEAFDYRAAQISTVSKQMEILRAEFQNRITELQAKYNSLLAIESGVTTVESDDDIPF
jgi:hypothetical protein